MLTLAFESSAKAASVALCEDGQLIGQVIQCSALTHSRTLLPMADSRIFPSLSEKPNAASISAPAPLRTACEEPFAFPDTNLICTFPFSPFREANPEKKSRLSFHGPCACLFVYRVFAFRQRQLITAMLSYHGKKLRTLTSFPESKTGNTK